MSHNKSWSRGRSVGFYGRSRSRSPTKIRNLNPEWSLDIWALATLDIRMVRITLSTTWRSALLIRREHKRARNWLRDYVGVKLSRRMSVWSGRTALLTTSCKTNSEWKITVRIYFKRKIMDTAARNWLDIHINTVMHLLSYCDAH